MRSALDVRETGGGHVLSDRQVGEGELQCESRRFTLHLAPGCSDLLDVVRELL